MARPKTVKNRYGTEKTNDDVFVSDSNYARHLIKKRIKRDNLIPFLCSECNQNETWNGKPLSLQLDHINGVNNDNRLENLRFLCPNCHSQQDTFAGKNWKKKKV